MAKSRRTRNAKRINDGAAEDLLKVRFASVGLKGVPIPKKSIEALSKVIGTNDMTAMSKIIAASIKYAQGVEAAATAAPAAPAPLDPAFASAVAMSTSAKHKKRSHKHRVKIDFTKRGTPTPVLPGPPRFPAPPMTPYDTCRAQCAASCAAKIKETPFVRKPGPLNSTPPPSSTQELHALFSNLSPARTPPTRRRLRKLGEVAPKPYYHQRTRVSNRGGLPAQNIPYRG